MSADLRAIPGGRDTRVAGRVPPHNLDAEEQVIVHALEGRRDVAVAVGVGLLPEHFYDPSNGRIWQAIVDIASSADGDATRTTVHEWLRARGWLDKIGGEARLRHLSQEIPLRGPMRGYARIVVMLARVRAVQAEAHLVASEPYGAIGDPDAWLESAPTRIAAASRGPRAKAPQTFAETLKASWELFTSTAGARGGYPTGLEPFDSMTGGLHPGEVLLVSAKEKAGKSMLVGQMFAALARTSYTPIDANGEPVLHQGKPARRRRAALIFALDSAKQTDWAERVAAADALVDLERFRVGLANDADRAALLRAIDRANDLPVHVDAEEIGSVAQMGARIRALRDELGEQGIDLCAVAIDYIQLAKGEGRTREEQIGSAMRGVVHLAGQKDLRGVAWVVISQTNSEGELAHCRALAQMCDSWVHLTVDDEKPSESWWNETAQGGEMVTVYPASLAPNRSRRGRMGKRARPIALWCCYKFTFFYGADHS